MKNVKFLVETIQKLCLGAGSRFAAGATVRWPLRHCAHSPKGDMWADERIREKCAFSSLDSHVK
jgi:hypothetical protein